MSQDRSPVGFPEIAIRSRAAAGLAALAAIAAPSIPAFAGTPRVSSVYPSVAQRGTEQEVVFAGSNIADARTVLFDAPGFDATVVKTEPTRFTVKIRVPMDAELGEHQCRVVTNSGVADVRLFFVSPFPVVEEAYPKVINTPARIAALRAAKAEKLAKAKAAAEAAAAKAAAEAAKAAATPVAAPAQPPATAPAQPAATTAQQPAQAAPPTPATPAPAKPAVPTPTPTPTPANATATAPAAPPAPKVYDPNEPPEPQEIALNTTVYGRTQGEDEDTFKVSLKKGQRFSVEMVGLQLQTQNPYDPELTIRKPDGSLWKTVGSTAFGKGNPVLSVEAPADGDYLLNLRDATRSGTGDCQYIMHLGDFPRPVAALPAGGPAGKQTSFTLLGDPKGSITVTSSPGLLSETLGGVAPSGSVPSPSPVPVRVSSLPNVVEGSTQVATPAEATGPATPLPVAFNGVLKQDKEKDFFRFSAKKGQAYEFTVFGRALRSPIDSVINVYDAKGNSLGTNDDNGSPDSYLRWTAPVDGEFVLGIRDHLERGGPLFAYRVEAAPTSPKVKVYLPEMTINSSQDRRAVVVPQGNRYSTLVRVKREDWGGALSLEPVNLPPDVKASSGVMDKTVDTVVMTFEASENAPLTQRLFTMAGTPVDPAEGAVPPTFRVEHSVNTSENGNQRPFYTVKQYNLPVAVTSPIPAKIDVPQPSVPAMRGGQFPLKVKLERTGEFKGVVEAVLLYAPPGIATSGQVKIPADATEVTINLSVSPDAPLKQWNLAVAASADFGTGQVWFSSKPFQIEVAEAPLGGALVRTSISQGATGEMKLKLEQKVPFEGKAKIELLGLPNGVSSEPREVDSQTAEVVFPINAKGDAALGIQKQVTAQFTVVKNGTPLTANCAVGGILRVDKGGTPTAVAKATPAAAPAAPPAPAPAANAPAPAASAAPAPAAKGPQAPSAAPASNPPAPTPAAKPAPTAATAPVAPAAQAKPAPSAAPTAPAPAAPAPAPSTTPSPAAK